MFDFFTKHAKPVEVPKAYRSEASIIEEIHETFYTEVDRLLAEAKISHSTETTKDRLIEKRNRLVALGFTDTAEVKEANVEINRLEMLKLANNVKEKHIRAITHFSHKYPQYKFITEASVEKICEKYGLIYSTIDRYIGTVPDKNLAHIEKFSVAEDDECWLHRIESWMMPSMLLGGRPNTWGHKSYAEYKTWYAHEYGCDNDEPLVDPSDSEEAFRRMMLKANSQKQMNHWIERWEKAPLEIAALPKDFNTENMELSGKKLVSIVKNDPIVLKPVYFEGQKHYLVVTAWGLEASDESVVNERMN